MVIDPCGADIRVPEPFLHLGNVGVVIERVGGGGRSQCMHADSEPKLRRIAPHQLVDAIRGDRCFEAAGTVVPGRPKQCTAVVRPMSGSVEVVVDKRIGAWVQRQISGLAAFAGDFEMRHAFPRVPEIPDLERAQFLAPQRVEQQRRQDRAIALGLERIGRRRRQQLARLVVADRRRLAFGGFRLRPLDAFDRIMSDRVPAAQIFEQRSQRREPVPDRAAAETAPRELVAPGDDVRA